LHIARIPSADSIETIEIDTIDLTGSIADAERIGIESEQVSGDQWPSLKLTGRFDKLVEWYAIHTYRPRRGPVGTRSRDEARRDLIDILDAGS
jgi:hypothetical protein